MQVKGWGRGRRREGWRVQVFSGKRLVGHCSRDMPVKTAWGAGQKEGWDGWVGMGVCVCGGGGVGRGI